MEKKLYKHLLVQLQIKKPVKAYKNIDQYISFHYQLIFVIETEKIDHQSRSPSFFWKILDGTANRAEKEREERQSESSHVELSSKFWA